MRARCKCAVRAATRSSGRAAAEACRRGDAWDVALVAMQHGVPRLNVMTVELVYFFPKKSFLIEIRTKDTAGRRL